MNFSTWLRVKMAEHNINDTGLALWLGVSQVAIGRWRRGDNRPTYENCLKLASHFGEPASDILVLAGHPLPATMDDNPGTGPIHDAHTPYSTDPQLTEALDIFRDLSERDRDHALAILRTFVKRQRNE